MCTGGSLTIAPNSSDIIWGHRVQDPACGQNCIGRGHLFSANWNFYTYSP